MNLVTPEELKNAKDYIFKRGSATLLLIGADHGCYGPMKNQMQQNMAMGTNNYPKLVNKAMNILNTFAKTIKTTFIKNHEAEGMQVAFAQTRDLNEISCYHCGNKVHYANTCPKKEPKKDRFILKWLKPKSKRVMLKMSWAISIIKVYQV